MSGLHEMGGGGRYLPGMVLHAHLLSIQEAHIHKHKVALSYTASSKPARDDQVRLCHRQKKVVESHVDVCLACITCFA